MWNSRLYPDGIGWSIFTKRSEPVQVSRGWRSKMAMQKNTATFGPLHSFQPRMLEDSTAPKNTRIGEQKHLPSPSNAQHIPYEHGFPWLRMACELACELAALASQAIPNCLLSKCKSIAAWSCSSRWKLQTSCQAYA